jgi:dihydrolipoamide dehydrogenase
VVTGVQLDMTAMMSRKEKVVRELTQGVEFLIDKNGIDYIKGTGRITGAGQVLVERLDGQTETISAGNILIATGSDSTPLAGVEVDEQRIVSSTGALGLESVPSRLIVIGAGVIGLELGSVWSRLGAEVVVVELLDHILPGMDREVTRRAQRVLEKQGLEFQLSTQVRSAAPTDDGVTLSLESSNGGADEALRADVVLLAIGRRPYTEGLGLPEIGVALDKRGFVEVNRRFETNVAGIYAIGDCIGGPMLAHKAEDEGAICAEILAGESGQIDYDRVPSVVYTWPEIAAVGQTEEALREAGVEYRVGKFPFSANSRGRITGDTDGFVKILADQQTDRVLGVHILGPLAGDLISEAVIALEFGASAEDVARTCHAHPSMGEALREAALDVARRALHI